MIKCRVFWQRLDQGVSGEKVSGKVKGMEEVARKQKEFIDKFKGISRESQLPKKYDSTEVVVDWGFNGNNKKRRRK